MRDYTKLAEVCGSIPLLHIYARIIWWETLEIREGLCHDPLPRAGPTLERGSLTSLARAYYMTINHSNAHQYYISYYKSKQYIYNCCGLQHIINEINTKDDTNVWSNPNIQQWQVDPNLVLLLLCRRTT